MHPTKTEYIYNDTNQMTTAGTQSIAVNGNVTNDGRYEYVQNAFDQLTEVKTMAGATIATYKCKRQIAPTCFPGGAIVMQSMQFVQVRGIWSGFHLTKALTHLMLLHPLIQLMAVAPKHTLNILMDQADSLLLFSQCYR